MANPKKGEAVATVAAGAFTLAFDLGACAAIEGAMGGKPFQDVLAQLDSETPSVTALLTVLWAGLQKHHKLSREDVGHLVSMDELGIWGEAIGQAFETGTPEAPASTRPQSAKAE